MELVVQLKKTQSEIFALEFKSSTLQNSDGARSTLYLQKL